MISCPRTRSVRHVYVGISTVPPVTRHFHVQQACVRILSRLVNIGIETIVIFWSGLIGRAPVRRARAASQRFALALPYLACYIVADVSCPTATIRTILSLSAWLCYCERSSPIASASAASRPALKRGPNAPPAGEVTPLEASPEAGKNRVLAWSLFKVQCRTLSAWQLER